MDKKTVLLVSGISITLLIIISLGIIFTSQNSPTENDNSRVPVLKTEAPEYSGSLIDFKAELPQSARDDVIEETNLIIDTSSDKLMVRKDSYLNNDNKISFIADDSENKMSYKYTLKPDNMGVKYVTLITCAEPDEQLEPYASCAFRSEGD